MLTHSMFPVFQALNSPRAEYTQQGSRFNDRAHGQYVPLGRQLKAQVGSHLDKEAGEQCQFTIVYRCIYVRVLSVSLLATEVVLV